MAKETKGDFWIEPASDVGVFNIGFTPESLVKFGTIWNLVPRDLTTVTESKPFVNIESRRCLTCLRSPVSGKVVSWNDGFLDLPDSITADVVLLQVQT